MTDGKEPCFYCGHMFLVLTRDHVIPKSAGGLIPDNTVLACCECNQKKADRLPTSAEIEKFIRQEGHYPGKERGANLMCRYQSQLNSQPIISESDRFQLKIENKILRAKYLVGEFIKLEARRYITEINYGLFEREGFLTSIRAEQKQRAIMRWNRGVHE